MTSPQEEPPQPPLPEDGANHATAEAAPAQRKGKSTHHLLRHTVTPAVRAAAAELFCSQGATPEEGGAAIWELQQRELRVFFEQVYNTPTNSCNNGWMRGKLLQALGLGAHWQPEREDSKPLGCSTAGTHDPTAAERGTEVSRFGRRVRRRRLDGEDGDEDGAATARPAGNSGGEEERESWTRGTTLPSSLPSSLPTSRDASMSSLGLFAVSGAALTVDAAGGKLKRRRSGAYASPSSTPVLHGSALGTAAAAAAAASGMSGPVPAAAPVEAGQGWFVTGSGGGAQQWRQQLPGSAAQAAQAVSGAAGAWLPVQQGKQQICIVLRPPPAAQSGQSSPVMHSAQPSTAMHSGQDDASTMLTTTTATIATTATSAVAPQHYPACHAPAAPAAAHPVPIPAAAPQLLSMGGEWQVLPFSSGMGQAQHTLQPQAYQLAAHPQPLPHHHPPSLLPAQQQQQQQQQRVPTPPAALQQAHEPQDLLLPGAVAGVGGVSLSEAHAHDASVLRFYEQQQRLYQLKRQQYEVERQWEQLQQQQAELQLQQQLHLQQQRWQQERAATPALPPLLPPLQAHLQQQPTTVPLAAAPPASQQALLAPLGAGGARLAAAYWGEHGGAPLQQPAPATAPAHHHLPAAPPLHVEAHPAWDPHAVRVSPFTAEAAGQALMQPGGAAARALPADCRPAAAAAAAAAAGMAAGHGASSDLQALYNVWADGQLSLPLSLTLSEPIKAP